MLYSIKLYVTIYLRMNFQCSYHEIVNEIFAKFTSENRGIINNQGISEFMWKSINYFR
jgi:hypothetical protein